MMTLPALPPAPNAAIVASSPSSQPMLDISKCRACGGDYGRRFELNSYHYGVCRNCKSILKILSQDQYNALDPTYDPGAFIENLTDENWREHLHIDEYKGHLAPIIPKLSERHPKQTLKLLDIGCGMGGFLLAAKESGLEAYGVEPSESHSLIGRTRFGLNIRSAYFSRDDYRDAEFDIVVLWHVIEHIFDQSAFLKDVYSVLRPGGIVLIATPNAGSTVATLTGTNWSMLRPVDHVGMLTPQAFSYIAPAGSSVSVNTGEYLWEPFVSLAGATRNMIVRALAPNSGPPGGYRDTVSRINDNKILRATAIMLSAPIFVFDKAFSRASCIMCKIEKPI
jgi:2-polyprenyl-3-methyl-5-hydroxy-6-metoxy-1,4-benzoquinol methylase